MRTCVIYLQNQQPICVICCNIIIQKTNQRANLKKGGGARKVLQQFVLFLFPQHQEEEIEVSGGRMKETKRPFQKIKRNEWAVFL